MRNLSTDYGEVYIGTDEEIYAWMLGAIEEGVLNKDDNLARIGLSGGSTPKAFYKWCADNDVMSPLISFQCRWTTSDERHMLQDSLDSNFGNAARMMLNPLKVPRANRWPWPTLLTPNNAAKNVNDQWDKQVSREKGFDVCFLGMGDDCHTASLFPGCSLIGSGIDENFAAVEWPERGWRLTVTEAGLARSKKIVVAVTGAGKQEALHEVFHGPFDPMKKPIQVLKPMAKNVVWLLDEAAAQKL